MKDRSWECDGRTILAAGPEDRPAAILVRIDSILGVQTVVAAHEFAESCEPVAGSRLATRTPLFRAEEE